MNLLAFLWLIGCAAAVLIAFAVDDDVWRALAERIRNPRPSTFELMYRHWEAEDAAARDAWDDSDGDDSDNGSAT